MYDIIIVGSGVAGSYISSLLADFNVLVIEKDKKVILKDSGIVSKNFDNFFDDKKLIKDEIDEMVAVSPSGYKFSLNSESPYAYLLERKKFSFFLRKMARKNCDVKYEKSEKIEYHDDFVSVITDKNEYACKIVIGCDGANSIVRQSAGIKNPRLIMGLFSFSKVKKEKIHIFFDKNYSDEFFSWVIPQNNEYGLMAEKNAMAYLYRFMSDKEIKGGKILGSQIPIGFTKSFAKRTLLIGDACGQVKPLSGGGIIFSLAASRYAAETIKNAFEKQRFDKKILYEYEKSWKNDFAGEIRKQLLFRKIYKKMNNRQIDMLFRKFGPKIEKINDFDYDKLSKSWKRVFLPFIN